MPSADTGAFAIAGAASDHDPVPESKSPASTGSCPDRGRTTGSDRGRRTGTSPDRGRTAGTGTDTGADRTTGTSPGTSTGTGTGTGRTADPDRTKLSPGDPGHARMRLALFAAGLAAFALLYSTQALLPEISRDLAVDPGLASWTVSGATIGLAVAVLPLAALSERFGRRRMLTLSLAVAVALALAVPFAPDLGTLIALRTLQGAAVAGVPASAMAYLADEVRAKHLVGATGLFVAGNSVGGMSGRILTGWVTQAWGWRPALASVAVMALLCAVAFRLLAPRARHFRPAPLHARDLARTVAGHLRNPLLARLYAIGLLFMFVFGGVYTVVGYRLVSEPFGLSQGLVGSVFVIYLVGTVTSATAGRLNARIGRRGTLYAGVVTASSGLALTLLPSLVAVIAGLVLITAGFFAGHAVASGSVSHTATTGRAQASALYQMTYYIGSSLGAALGAVAYATGGWQATVGLSFGAMAVAGGITYYGTRSAAAARRRRLAEARA